MKTVIHVWAQHHKKSETSYPKWVGNYGLGDLLRGSIGLFRYCENKGYNFIVDFSLHPISLCLKVKDHQFSESVKANSNNIIALLDKDIDKFIINELSNSNHVLLATNCWVDQFNIPATPGLKKFIKDLFDFTEHFNTYVSSYIATIPFKPYEVIHFRLGDNALINNMKSDKQQKCLDTINSIKTSKSILLTDSNYLKEAAKSSGIFMLNKRAAHIGSSTNNDAITHTLFEFILLTRAVSINSYTIYLWTSGFAIIANFIFDVPLNAHVKF